jgi:hypothetical protein
MCTTVTGTGEDIHAADPGLWEVWHTLPGGVCQTTKKRSFFLQSLLIYSTDKTSMPDAQ